MFKLICTVSFAIALLFTQVAHGAVPTPTPLRAVYDATFDNPTGSLNVACPMPSPIPECSYIGGAFDVSFNSPNCGACWNITNPANRASIYMTAVDIAVAGFGVGSTAFGALNGGGIGTGVIDDVVATKVAPSFCQCPL